MNLSRVDSDIRLPNENNSKVVYDYIIGILKDNISISCIADQTYRITGTDYCFSIEVANNPKSVDEICQ